MIGGPDWSVVCVAYSDSSSRRGERRWYPASIQIPSFVSSAGKISPAFPCNMNSFMPSKLTSSRFTWMTAAPAAKAFSGILAAGMTTPDVPTETKRSHLFTCCIADRHALSGKFSPNHTTSGRSRPLQRIHRGGSISCPSSGTASCSGVNSAGRLHAKHFAFSRLPWT